MNYRIINDENNEVITTLKTRKNTKHSTLIDKVKEELKRVFNYNENFKMLPTGSINYVTGESNIKYVCFGIKKTIRIEAE